MNSRNKILQNIAKAHYPDVSKPDAISREFPVADVEAGFLEACCRNGTELIAVSDRDIAQEAYRKIVLQNETAGGSHTTLLVESTLGVAENGSVWLAEDALPGRVAPFACEHLCVLLSKDDLVATMHHAYQRLTAKGNGKAGLSMPGFGVFIAGPSKTADIEQTLVIGAQGSKQHTLLFITST